MAIRLRDYDGHARAGIDYCQRVVSGEIRAGKYTVLACQRHLNDIESPGDYVFDADEGNRVAEFIELLPHTKGKWAAQRQLIKLEPWQSFIITALFGWLRKKDGLRRFRKAYICVPRKNGKSIFAAGIGLYMLTLDGEYGAEVYSGATSEKQAWEVFKPAKIMAQKTPELMDAAGLDVMAKALSIPDQGSKFEPVIGNPGDGASPSCAIIDEYHEHDSPALYETMETGMGAREQPLMLTITTSGSNIGGPCYQLHKDCISVLDGAHVNDEQFAVIYGIDENDDWTCRDALIKANPNFGVSVFEDFLVAKQMEAASSPAKQNTFRTKHLNQWVSARSAWLNMLEWNKCEDVKQKIDDFAGLDSIVAIDLASRIDMAVWLRLFTVIENGLTHYYIFPEYYLPDDTIADDKTGKYAGWHIDGYLRATDGNEIDFGVIRDDIYTDMKQHRVDSIVYDPWRATQLAQELSSDGASCVEFRQTVQNMSPAMYEVEAAIKSGRLHHDGNPITTWMASNVVAKVDAKDNIYPRKERKENKIDGIVALIMAVGMAMQNADVNAYETMELRTI